MKTLPDVSTWFANDPRRFDDEDQVWREHREFVDYANYVTKVCERYSLRSVLEVGCGCGYVGQMLPNTLVWSGVDAYQGCVDAARKNNPGSNVSWGDLRKFHASQDYDLVCSFAFLKHFSLQEFPAIVARLLSMASYSLNTVQVGAQDEDDGTEVHHNWISVKTLDAVIAGAGHKIIAVTPRWESGPHSEVFLATRRINGSTV